MASLSGVPPFFHFHCVTSSGSLEPPVVKMLRLAEPEMNARSSEPPAEPLLPLVWVPLSRFQSSAHPAGLFGEAQAVPLTTAFPSSSTELLGISCATTRPAKDNSAQATIRHRESLHISTSP